MVADDLGYTDIGVFGGEIDTPHLVALGFRGVENAGVQIGPASCRRDCDCDGAIGTGKIIAERSLGCKSGMPRTQYQCNAQRRSIRERFANCKVFRIAQTLKTTPDPALEFRCLFHFASVNVYGQICKMF